jgi:hypothetical protein
MIVLKLSGCVSLLDLCFDRFRNYGVVHFFNVLWSTGYGPTTRFLASVRVSTSGAVEQTAGVFAALAATSEPLEARGLAALFKPTKGTEKKVSGVLASLARLGYVTTEDGKTFILRRAA